MTEPKKPPRRLVELVDPAYQPRKAEREEEWTPPDISLEEAARRVLEPVDVVTIPRPRKEGTGDFSI